MSFPNVSSDLVWEVTRNQNAYLVKRNSGGGVQFSRDPFNLTNKHSRKYAGFADTKALGISANEKGGVQVITKKPASAQQPAKSRATTTYGGNKSGRTTYKRVANQAAKFGYRADLREAAVARVSAIRRSQRPVKADPEKKLRGNAAKKAEAEKA